MRLLISIAFALNLLLVVPTQAQQLLLAPDSAAVEYFGSSVSLSGSGDRVVVGAHGDDGPGGDFTGSAHLFYRAQGGGWAYEQKLLAPDGAAGDTFGNPVGISSSGDTIIVGAPGDETLAGISAGSAHIFTRAPGGSWTHQKQLLAPDGAPGDGFGVSVSLSQSGDTAVVGASFDKGMSLSLLIFSERRLL